MRRWAFISLGPFVLVASPLAGATNRATELALVDPAAVTERGIGEWRSEGFKGLVVVLDERFSEKEYEAVASQAGSFKLFYWIEVGRNPAMAERHPHWMASIGMHDDWRRRFSGIPPLKEGQVAKAFPWLALGYREVFQAQLQRIDALLKRVPDGYEGLLLNDLQSGPSSCGCGNLQCRWATDYHVPATGTRIGGDDVAARFISAVRQRAPRKQVVPVWLIECEDEDLPADQRPARDTTGYCGSVGCAVGLCPKEFTKQWSALWSDHHDPVAVLALPNEFERGGSHHDQGPGWLDRVAAYLKTVPPRHGGSPAVQECLWLVVSGRHRAEEAALRRKAQEKLVSAVVVARIRLDQSYEPRIISVKQAK